MKTSSSAPANTTCRNILDLKRLPGLPQEMKNVPVLLSSATNANSARHPKRVKPGNGHLLVERQVKANVSNDMNAVVCLLGGSSGVPKRICTLSGSRYLHFTLLHYSWVRSLRWSFRLCAKSSDRWVIKRAVCPPSRGIQAHGSW